VITLAASPVDELLRLRHLSKSNCSLAMETWRQCRELEELLSAKTEVLARAQEFSARPSSPRVWDGRPIPSPSAGQAENPPPDALLLMVEDNADDFLLLQRALQRKRVNARTHWARCSREALDALDHVHLDVARIDIVSDVQLPGEDGFQFLRSVREAELLQPVRFAFLTGHCDAATEQRALECGADGFFSKPVQFAELVQIVGKLQSLFGLETAT
jgi:CheY-like chemotaxis protein